ncbi:WD repeat-containing protein 43 [Phytophthora cinnamomi]|uniref:WD repeat-containing protein 43 n=1 Tax=Phytophthora cinnamomi TaxID=4785 RepID=UPI00355994CB|nr:WD repeat-containing protein 43 [Phytophthora cinnamomi]
MHGEKESGQPAKTPQAKADTMANAWRSYSAYFQDLEFRLEHMNEMPKGLVIVSASLRVTVTTETIKHVFPHLSPCPSENRDVKGMLLGKKLIGAQLLLPSTLHFEWDSATRQIVRLQTSTDFLVPLCREFGNLNDASFVLDGANITLDGAILARGL